MEIVSETTEVQPKWLKVLRRQGRSKTWLARETGVTYPIVTHYGSGRTEPPPQWLEKVSELLGEDVR